MTSPESRFKPAEILLISKTVSRYKLKTQQEVQINTGFCWVPMRGQIDTYQLSLPHGTIRHGLYYSTAGDLCTWKSNNPESGIVVRTGYELVDMALVEKKDGDKYLRSPRHTDALKNLAIVS